MSTNFGSPGSIVGGRMAQARANEDENTFSTINQAPNVTENNTLDTGDMRMAGEVGARAMQLMNDPEEFDRTMGWMNLFSRSNDGARWNEARMYGGAPPPE
jgi:hypothetical protein